MYKMFLSKPFNTVKQKIDPDKRIHVEPPLCRFEIQNNICVLVLDTYKYSYSPGYPPHL